MSTLKIAYFDISANASRVLSNLVVPSDNLLNALHLRHFAIGKGRRACLGYSNVSASPAYWTYDLGSNYATKQNKANYIYIAGAKLLQEIGVTQVRLLRSSDNATFTAEATISSFGSVSLIGADSRDYFTSFTLSGSYRYWKVEITGATTVYVGKIYFGQLFEPTYEPDYEISRLPLSEPFISSSGAYWNERQKRELYKIRLDYNCLTESDITAFSSKILAQSHVSDFVLIASSSDMLDNKTAIHCSLVNATIQKRNNSIYDLSTEWVESDG